MILSAKISSGLLEPTPSRIVSNARSAADLGCVAARLVAGERRDHYQEALCEGKPKNILAFSRRSLRTSKAVHRCQDAVLDDGSKRDGVGLAVKPSVRISLDLVRIAEPKINLANGVARSKVATPPARTKPTAAITRGVTGASDAFAPYASPLPAQPLTDLPA